MRLATALRIAGCTAALAGCGGGSAPADTLKEYANAVQDKDFKTACELLETSQRELMDGGRDGGCELALEDYLADGFPKDTMKLLDDGRYEVETSGDRATVTPEGKGGFTLVREDGDWRMMNAQ